jgi:malate dehydrogenase
MVSVIGSGNVGANTAFFVAEKGIEQVLLYDLREGLAAGKSLDMMEASPVRRYRNRVRAAESLEAIAASEIVVLAAGQGRKPGMKREELYEVNVRLAEELGPQVARLAPECNLIVATEPVDLMTMAFLRCSGLPRQRVFGIGGCLDATRLRYAVARELGISTEDVTATVIGRHSDAMIVLPRYCNVSGVPLPLLLPAERLVELIAEVRRAGDLIVQMAQRSSAFYAPSAAAADLVDAVHMDLHRVQCVSLGLEGEYGVRGVAMSLPAVIGSQGVLRVLTPELDPEERRRFRESAGQLERIQAEGGRG